MAVDAEQMVSALDSVEQPVFFVCGGLVERVNRAADRLGLTAGRPLEEQPGAEVFLALRAAGAAAAEGTAVLLGQTYSVRRLLHGGAELFVLRREGDGRFSPDTLLSVSQRLREPLSNLFGAASSLFPVLEELEDPGLQRSLGALNRAFYQLLRLSGNLSDAAALLAGEVSLQRERTELSGFLNELLGRAEPLYAELGVGLERMLPARRVYAWIDRQWLERAVLNLLSNALRASQRGGSVRVRLTADAGNALLCVTDRGEGMSPEALSAAFSRYELRPGQADPRWGLGLGLPIAREVARLHGGALVLETRPGQTDAALSLPLAEPDADATALRSPRVRYDSTGGYRRELIEFSDLLPAEVFDTRNLE